MLAAGSLRLRDLSVLRAAERIVMAAVVFRSWFDDSERDDAEQNVAAVAGCVGTDTQWEKFETAWQTEILDRFGLPYLHMKELRQFPRFSDSQSDDSKELAKAIVTAISQSQIRPFTCFTRLRDLKRFNKDCGQQLNAYSLNIYGCMRLMRQLYREELAAQGSYIQMNMDRFGKSEQKLIVAREFAATNTIYPETAELVHPVTIPPNHSMRTILPLQAADYIAWECRKDTEYKDEWYESREDGKKGTDYDRFKYPSWPDENGYDMPWRRISMGSFARNTRWVGWGWTYDVLEQENNSRGGVWTRRVQKKRRASAAQSS